MSLSEVGSRLDFECPRGATHYRKRTNRSLRASTAVKNRNVDGHCARIEPIEACKRSGCIMCPTWGQAEPNRESLEVTIAWILFVRPPCPPVAAARSG